jgi:DnaJ-class molecular chaperone
MAEDPYKVLGVPRDAPDEEIRRVYRKLAKQLHPDLNPSNPDDVVGDPVKRKQYDRGEIDANGEPRRGYQRAQAGGAGPFGGRAGSARQGEEFGFGDIFSDLFGGARAGGWGEADATRGRDVRYTLEIDFLEAATGAKKRVTMPDGGVLDLTVPQGVSDGQVLRLKGKGSPGARGSEAGDALVEIKVKPHPQFSRAGDDIALELPITIDEAVLGAKVEVPTVSGRVQLTIPKGASSGRVFRLKGKGVHNSTTGSTGDQLVTVRIVLPQTIDDKLAYFMSEWRQSHRYDPRKS